MMTTNSAKWESKMTFAVDIAEVQRRAIASTAKWTEGVKIEKTTQEKAMSEPSKLSQQIVAIVWQYVSAKSNAKERRNAAFNVDAFLSENLDKYGDEQEYHLNAAMLTQLEGERLARWKRRDAAPVTAPVSTGNGSFRDLLPLTPVRVAPGEYHIKARDGRMLWWMDGAALADWVCASVNGYDAAINTLSATSTIPDGERELTSMKEDQVR